MDTNLLKQSLVIQGEKIIKLEETVKLLSERILKLESRISLPISEPLDYSIAEIKNQLLLQDELSDWEQNFIRSLKYTSESAMSTKQKETLRKIYKEFVRKFEE